MPEVEIHNHLTRYLTSEISLSDLHLLLLPALARIDAAVEPEALRLASRAVRFISEYGLGHRTERELCELLRDLTTTDGTAAPQSASLTHPFEKS